MNNPLMKVVCLALLGVLLALPEQPKAQSSYPLKPVRLLTPFAVGTGAEVNTRLFGAKLSDQIRQPVVIDSKPGAGGMPSYLALTGSKPDGYTLLIGANTALISKLLQPSNAYDPIADFAPISQTSVGVTVLVVRADSPARNVEDLVSQAKANPGKLNYSSGGIASPAHLACATFVAIAGISVTHIPFKGGGEFLPSLLRGESDFACPAGGNGMPFVKTGKLRALAVTGASRSNNLPDVPTLREVLKSELVVQEIWGGIWAPAKTPTDVIRFLHGAVVNTIADPALRQHYEASGQPLVASNSPEAFGTFLMRENDKWREIVKISGAKVD